MWILNNHRVPRVHYCKYKQVLGYVHHTKIDTYVLCNVILFNGISFQWTGQCNYYFLHDSSASHFCGQVIVGLSFCSFAELESRNLGNQETVAITCNEQVPVRYSVK